VKLRPIKIIVQVADDDGFKGELEITPDRGISFKGRRP